MALGDRADTAGCNTVIHIEYRWGATITKGKFSWNTSSLTLGNDPMTDLKWPGKLDAAARQSLQTAQAAGQRFFESKFELRNKVLQAYDDYALTAALIRLEELNAQLLELTASTTSLRNQTGAASLGDTLKARDEVDLSNNDLAMLRSQLPSQAAAINALVGRAPQAALPAPTELPAQRSVVYDEEEIIQLASRNNFELSALALDAGARAEAVRQARLQYVPDFNVSVSTDLAGVAQSLIGQATVPLLRYEAINAAIAQAEANLRASEAARHQTARDLVARIITDSAAIKDADRQINLFQNTVLPRQREAADLERSAYENGRASLLELLESERSLIEVERLADRSRTLRENELADLESITTVDLSVRPQRFTPAGIAEVVHSGS